MSASYKTTARVTSQPEKFRSFQDAGGVNVPHVVQRGMLRKESVAAARAIAANDSFTSEAFLVAESGTNAPAIAGFGSIQCNISGTGTLKAEILASNTPDDAASFVTPDGMQPIFTGKTLGRILTILSVPPCVAFKVKFTETGLANPVTLTADMALL